MTGTVHKHGGSVRSSVLILIPQIGGFGTAGGKKQTLLLLLLLFFIFFTFNSGLLKWLFL